MILALQVVLIGYVVLWAVLLLCCWRKREFCPVWIDSRRTRRFWLATFVLVNPILTILYLIYGQLRSPQAPPVKVVRNTVFVVGIAGFFVNLPGVTHLWMQPLMGRMVPVDHAAEFYLAAIQTNQGSESVTVDSGYANRRLACRRIVMVIDGRHPLLQRVGWELAKRLEQLAIVETVEVRPDGTYPPDGGPSPDLFARLYLDDLRELPIPYSTRLKAQIGLEVNTVPIRCTDYRRQECAPAACDFNIAIDFSHRSTTTGYESVRYLVAGRQIASELNELVTERLVKWHAKYGLLPELPAAFYGDYRAGELPEPLEQLEPLQIASYSGLLRHNETYYQFALAREPVERLAALYEAMAPLGWTKLSDSDESPAIHLRMQNGDRHIYIFQIPRRRVFHGQRAIARTLDGAANYFFGVIDTESFDAAQRRRAVDALYAESASPDELVLFEHLFDAEQEERFASLLREQPPHEGLAYVKLAEIYQHRGSPAETVEAMRLARALLWADRDPDRYRHRLSKLAAELGDNALADAEPTRQDFLDAGFVEFDPQADPLEFETELNVPVRVFLEDARGQLWTQTLVVAPQAERADRFAINYVTKSQRSPGFGSHDALANPASCFFPVGIGDIFIGWEVNQMGQTSRFKLIAEACP